MSMSVCLSVCLLAKLENCMAELCQIFVHVACGLARSFSDGITICYVFPVLWMTSFFMPWG